MSWENTLYMVENYSKVIDDYFDKMEKEKTFIETYNIPEPTTKTSYKGFSLDLLYLGIKEYTFYVDHVKYTTYYWNDYYFLEPRIVELTPEQYVKYTYQIENEEFTNMNNVFKRPDIINEVVEEYKDQINADQEKFNMPYLEFVEGIFDGRHRALGAYKAGLTGIPCVIFI